MVMNLTNLTNSDTLFEIAQYSNSSTSGVLFNGFLIVFVIVMFLAFYKKDATNAFLASSWIGAILGVLLYTAGLVSLITILILLILAAGSAVFVYMSKQA